MRMHRIMGLAGTRRCGLVVAVALMAPVAGLVAASPAAAEPQGIFKIFKECPTEVPGVTLCNYAVTTSGEFKLGSTSVPINMPIVQQGGLIPTGNPENEREFFGYPAKNGESLSKTELNVPGGLLDLVNCTEIKGEGVIEKGERALCKSVFENKTTGVTATAELVANAKNPVILNEAALAEEKGTALTLPLRVHLKNPLLGKACYIGSESSPLELHLTTGETHPPAGFKALHGKLGTPETLKENGLRLLRTTNNTLVDNTFPAPGSEGCGEIVIIKGILETKGFLDSLVNGKLKIPNTAGNNAAIFNGELNIATAEHVRESEGF